MNNGRFLLYNGCFEPNARKIWMENFERKNSPS